MDAELELINLCEKVINAGTTSPGTWEMSQRALVTYCRDVLNRLAVAKVGGRQRQVLDSLEDVFASKIGDARKPDTFTKEQLDKMCMDAYYTEEACGCLAGDTPTHVKALAAEVERLSKL